MRAGDLCGSLFPLADLCAAGPPELPATLVRRPGGLSAQPLPQAPPGEGGGRHPASPSQKKKKNQPRHHFPQRPAGGKAMPHSSAEPASQQAGKPAGHPPALPPAAPGPTINPMTLASPPVPKPVSSPAPPHPRLGVRKRNKSTSNTLKTCRGG